MPQVRRTSIWSRLKRDRRGASAVEFALIAPLMLTFYFGLTELCQAMLADRRAGHVASAVGDLVTQADELSTADITDIFNIGRTILTPFPSNTLQMRTSHLTANAQNVPLVDWSRGYGGMSARAKNSTVAVNVPITAGQSVVVTELTYQYNSLFGYFVPDGINYVKKTELRPRFGKTNCTAPCT